MVRDIELAVEGERFSISPVEEAVRTALADDLDHLADPLARVFAVLPSDKRRRGLLQGLARWSFLIEPVKTPKIDSTKYETRWGDRISEGDPRKASYEECLLVFETLVGALADAVSDAGRVWTLVSFLDDGSAPYSLPVDYRQRHLDGPIHTAQNSEWFWDGLAVTAPPLRGSLLRYPDKPTRAFFKRTYKKVYVKANLTDRVLTGAHKTNREKRWESHPASVHFATRRDCLGIEASLINQICYFAGFPEDLRRDLEERGLIGFDRIPDAASGSFSDRVARCPITFEPLSYADFKAGVMDPAHGKSAYQVGHLHPLKSVEDSDYSGHTPGNISWVSAEGNRIQGERSVEETRRSVLAIAERYREAGVDQTGDSTDATSTAA